MAKAPAAPQADAADAAAPKKSKKLLLIIVIIVLVLVLLALAAVVGLLLMKKGGASDTPPPPAAEAPPPPMQGAVDLTKPPVFVPLDPFVVNLNPAEGDRYLQVVITLRVADAKTGDSIKNFMPEIRHRINLVLARKLPSELATSDGREDLADEIVEQSNAALGFASTGRRAVAGPIQAVLFNSFIIQ